MRIRMHPPSPPYRTPKVPSARVSYRCCPRSFSRRGPSLRSRCFSCRGLPRAHAQPVYYTGVALVLFLIAALLALSLSLCIIAVLPSFFFLSRPSSALLFFFFPRPSSRSRYFSCCDYPRAFVLCLVVALLAISISILSRLSAFSISISFFFLLRLFSRLRSLSRRGPPRALDLYLVAAFCVLIVFLEVALLALSISRLLQIFSRSRSLSYRPILRSHCFSFRGPPHALGLFLVAAFLAPSFVVLLWLSSPSSISVLPRPFSALSLFFLSRPSSRSRFFSCRGSPRALDLSLVPALFAPSFFFLLRPPRALVHSRVAALVSSQVRFVPFLSFC